MPFDLIEQRVGSSVKNLPASVSLSKWARQKRPSCIISISKALAAEIKATAKDKFDLLIGSGEHRGLVRLRKNAKGIITARELRGGALLFNLGFIERYGEDVQPKAYCNAEAIGAAEVEIVMPPWADGRPKTVASAPSPAPAATPLQKQAAVADADRRKRLGLR